MTVKDLINELDALDPSMIVVIEGRELKSVEWDTFYDEDTGEDYQVVNFVLEKKSGKECSKCAYYAPDIKNSTSPCLNGNSSRAYVTGIEENCLEAN